MSEHLNKKNQLDPGIGTNYKKETGRLILPDGKFNVKKIGHKLNAASLYHYMINISWWQFLFVVFGFFTILNMIFAMAYFINGVESIQSKLTDTLSFNAYLEAFYFSVQTFTTVGYGSLTPSTTFTNLFASAEMLVGISTAAIVTGVAYGKFSKPRAKLLFSKKLLVAPYKEGTSLMFRIANIRRSQLLEVKAKVILSFEEKTKDGFHRHYHELKLERDEIMFFPLSWTIVHEIGNDTPLADWQKTDFFKKKVEVIVQISGYDETYHQEVYQRNSYTGEDLIWGATFDKAFSINKQQTIEFDLKKLHSYTKFER